MYQIQAQPQDGDHHQPGVHLTFGNGQILHRHGNGKVDARPADLDPFRRWSRQDLERHPRYQRQDHHGDQQNVHRTKPRGFSIHFGSSLLCFGNDEQKRPAFAALLPADIFPSLFLPIK